MGTFLENDSSLVENHKTPASLRSTASPTIKSLCVAWIDCCQLTRECFANAAPALQPRLTIIPFASINDYLPYSDLTIDLVGYYVHDLGTDPTNEILMVRKALPNRKLLIVCDLSNSDRSKIANSFYNDMVAFMQPQKASLHFVVSALYLVHNERRFSFDDILSIAPKGPPHLDNGEVAIGASLTQRERSVLELIRHGQSNGDIAQTLRMSTSTVKAHVRNIMQKTRASNRTQLAFSAERQVHQRET